MWTCGGELGDDAGGCPCGGGCCGKKALKAAGFRTCLPPGGGAGFALTGTWNSDEAFASRTFSGVSHVCPRKRFSPSESDGSKSTGMTPSAFPELAAEECVPKAGA